MAGPTIASAEVDIDLDGKRITVQARSVARSAANALDKEMGKGGERSGKSFASGFQRGAKPGMDRTVKLVLQLIAAIGPQIAALGSGLSASLVALLSSAIVGLGGSLIALGGPLTGIIIGTSLLASAWSDMTAEGTALAGAIDELSEAWGRQAAALGQIAGPAIAGLFSSLAAQLNSVDLGAALGGSLAAVANAFTAVVNSPGFAAFMQALTTTIPAAMTGLGTGLAGLLGGFASLFAAAGPVAQQLGEQFAAWGQAFASSMEEMRKSGQLGDFFNTALESINALMGLLNPLTQALGNVFLIGAETGNSMLGTLGDLAEQFLAFTQSIAGQGQLQEWFSGGEQIFNALLPLVGAIGTALADMVTPQVISQVTTFLGDITAVIPVLGQLMSVIGQLNILGLFGQLLREVSEALAPVMPALGTLASTLGGALASAITAAAPLLDMIAQVIGQIVEAVTPLVVILGENLATAIGLIVQYATPLVDMFGQVLAALAPVAEEILAALLPALLQLVGALVSVFTALQGMAGGGVMTFVTSAIDLFGSALIGVANALGTVIGWVASAVTAFSQLLQGTGPIASFFTGLGTWVANAGRAIGNFATSVGQMVGRVVAFFQNLGTRVATTVTTLVAKVAAFFVNLSTRVVATVTSFVARVAAFFVNLSARVTATVTSFVAKVVAFFVNLGSRIASTVSTAVSNVVSFFAALPGRVISAVSSLASSIGTWISGVFTSLRNGVTTGIDNVVSWFRELPSKITSALSGASSLLTGIGSDIIGGLLSGLQGAWGGVTSWVSGAASGISGAFKSILGIASPSKVFIQIGKDTVEGFIIGFQRSAQRGKGAFEDLTRSALTSLTDGLAKGSEEAGKESVRILAKVRDIQIAAIRSNDRALKNAIRSVRKADLGKAETESTIADLRRTYAALNETVRTAGKNLRTTIRTNARELTDTLKEYESTVKQLEAARKKLDEMRQTRNQITEGLRNQLDLGSLVTNKEEGAGPITFAAVASYVAGMKTKAQKFSNRMKALVAAGLPPALVQQIAGLGMDAAIEVSNALLQGSPKELAKLKQDFSAFNAATTSVGDEVVKSMYGLGIAAQKGLIDGLVEDQGELKQAAKTFTDNLTKYVKKNLGIKSPSRVFRSIGEQVMNGMSVGLERGSRGVLSTMGSVIGGLTQAGSAGIGISATPVGQLGSGGALVATGGRSVVIQPGAIQVITPLADPRMVASQMLDRLVAKVG